MLEFARMTMTGGGFNYRGLKLGFAGVVVATVAGVPALLCDGSSVLDAIAYPGVLVGFAFTA